MTRFNFAFVIILSLTTSISAFIDLYGYKKIKTPIPSGLTADDALFLTPYIKKGQIAEAQKLARVPPLMKNVESFAGYLTVNETYSSNLFFWLFKSQHGDWLKQPTILWLQGGPGVSSLFGLFSEIGPFSVTDYLRLKRREYSWNRRCNLLFFDQPVGTGYSFTKTYYGFAKNETDVARDLYTALVQLFTLFPSLQRNKFFIAGESYAGKYIPAIGHKIYHENKVPGAALKINLGGLMIGNGLTDPENMLYYSDFLYKIGLVDDKTRAKLKQYEDYARKDIKDEEYRDALDWLNFEFNHILGTTGFQYPYDFTNDKIGIDDRVIKFVQKEKVRKAIHVGSYEFNDFYMPYNYLMNDMMQSVRPWVEELLTAEEFPIMFYSGQLDIIVAYPLSVAFYDKLQWPRTSEYREAKRCQFRVGVDVAGYFKTAGTFTEVMVRNTGHMVPLTQPRWAFELMDRFITNSSYFKC
nr:PREDICTED: venom serine carboxypeptidase-like [Bemisia tabaci]